MCAFRDGWETKIDVLLHSYLNVYIWCAGKVSAFFICIFLLLLYGPSLRSQIFEMQGFYTILHELQFKYANLYYLKKGKIQIYL